MDKNDRIYAPQIYTNKELSGKSGVYQIRNLINGKIYIGSSKNLLARKTQHFSDLKHGRHENPHLQHAYDKYKKDNFMFEIIEFCDTGDRIKIEQYWVNKFYRTRQCYNINSICELPNPRYGECNNRSTKVVCLDNMKVYNSLNEGSKDMGTNRRAIGSCCTGKNRMAADGTHWVYYDDFLKLSQKDIEKILDYDGDRKKSIICLENKMIFKSLCEAALKLNLNRGNISNCCNKTRHTEGGLHFLFLEDYKQMSPEEIQMRMLCNKGHRPIINLKTLEIYGSKQQCAEKLGWNKKTVYDHCYNRVKTPLLAYYEDYIRDKLDYKA